MIHSVSSVVQHYTSAMITAKLSTAVLTLYTELIVVMLVACLQILNILELFGFFHYCWFSCYIVVSKLVCIISKEAELKGVITQCFSAFSLVTHEVRAMKYVILFTGHWHLKGSLHFQTSWLKKINICVLRVPHVENINRLYGRDSYVGCQCSYGVLFRVGYCYYVPLLYSCLSVT